MIKNHFVLLCIISTGKFFENQGKQNVIFRLQKSWNYFNVNLVFRVEIEMILFSKDIPTCKFLTSLTFHFYLLTFEALILMLIYGLVYFVII